MKKQKVALYVVSVIACLGLTACSSFKKSQQAAGTGSSAAGSAQTYGVAGSADFVNQAKANAGNRMKAPANQTYFFSYDNSLVNQADNASVIVQARYLVQHPGAKVRVAGNTDERGSREYNIALGYRRAQAILHLLEQQGVSPKQIAIISYGKEQPVALGHNETAWAKNRRVNLTYEAY